MTHPEPQTLAAFAEGRLRGAEVAAIVEHLDRCDDCASDVALGMSAAREEDTSRRSVIRPWLFAIAAAIALAVIALAVVRGAIPFGGSPMDRLVALAPRSERSVEGRLSGGFRWAEYGGTRRATGSQTSAEGLKLAGAAGDLVERADRERTPRAQHDAGVALLLIGKPLDAIPRLEAAASTSRDAKPWSDLAAARYAAASQFGRASLYPLALAAADAALRIDPKLPEALFNRALIVERIGLADEARRAWQRYLDVDGSSPWANEARARLADLPKSTRSSKFERERPLLEGGDASVVRRIVAAHSDRARAFAETEYLGRWGEATQQHDAAEAQRWLTTARGIANALESDALLRDAVAAIDRATDADRTTIAEAHVVYRRGRMAYSRNELESAERDLDQAATLFASTRDPMALAARYYAAGVRLARNDVAGARAQLDQLRAEVDATPSYVNLAARVRWELGRVHILDDDWSGAVNVLNEGAALFRRCGSRADEAFVESLLARALNLGGRADDAWLARMRAFAALSAEGEVDLLATSVDAAMRAEQVAGRTDAALALSSLSLAIAQSSSQPQLVTYALLNEAMLQSISGHSGDALRAAQRAEESVRGSIDPALRARQLAEVAKATGAALAETDPRRASAALTRAIDFYRGHDLPFALPEPLLLRARCALRAGDAAAAMRDLEDGIALFERHREGSGMLDAEHALFTEAIRLSLARGDAASAFRFAERARGGAITAKELQSRLAGSGTVVVEIIALPDEVITFAVSQDDIAVARHEVAVASLVSLADASLSESIPHAAAELYQDVIRPVESVLADARELVVVPDPRLQSVPFAALYDGRGSRYLVDRFAVSTAANATSLQREARANARSVAAIALPTDAAALPDAEREVRDVAALYPRAEAIPAASATLDALRSAAASADVLHVAGHTEPQPGGGEQALLLRASSGAGLERVSWKTIVGEPPVRAGIVVLAACETLRPPASAATQALSLGAAFAAAGASDIIGTLAPIGDRDARLLFAALHRRVANGDRPADALRAVQQEAIARETEGGRRAWRSVALLTRRLRWQH